jgi:hypothetical protein
MYSCKKLSQKSLEQYIRVSIHLQRSHEALAIVPTIGVGKEISDFASRVEG